MLRILVLLCIYLQQPHHYPGRESFIKLCHYVLFVFSFSANSSCKWFRLLTMLYLRNLKRLVVEIELDSLSFLQLSRTLLSLEQLTIDADSLPFYNIASLKSAKFPNLKFFGCLSDGHQSLHMESFSHIIEMCFPNLRCLKLREEAGNIMGEDMIDFDYLGGLSINSSSLIATFRGLYLLSTCCIKKIRNLFVHVHYEDMEHFLSDAGFFSYGFSLTILNIVLDGWKYEEQRKYILATKLKIIRKNPKLEILSVRTKRKPEDNSCSYASEWIIDNDNVIKRSSLKLFIFDDYYLLQRFSLSANDIQVIDDLDDYGFLIRKGIVELS